MRFTSHLNINNRQADLSKAPSTSSSRNMTGNLLGIKIRKEADGLKRAGKEPKEKVAAGIKVEKMQKDEEADAARGTGNGKQ